MTTEPIVVCGVVEHGRQLGRTLGFPTANLPVDGALKALDGVYRAEVEIEGGAKHYPAMANLGCNPSVGGNRRRLETHLFGFEGSLYGRRIRVRLLGRIRGERTFASVEALRAQLERDREAVLAAFGWDATPVPAPARTKCYG